MTHTVQLLRHDAYNCTITAQIRAADQSHSRISYDYDNDNITNIVTIIVIVIFHFCRHQRKRKDFLRECAIFFALDVHEKQLLRRMQNFKSIFYEDLFLYICCKHVKFTLIGFLLEDFSLCFFEMELINNFFDI